jgi:hypothetical protein
MAVNRAWGILVGLLVSIISLFVKHGCLLVWLQELRLDRLVVRTLAAGESAINQLVIDNR